MMLRSTGYQPHILLLSLALLAVASACEDHPHEETSGLTGDHAHEADGHAGEGGGEEGHGHASIEVPALYGGQRNPHAGDEAVLDNARALYETHCASCHGAGGHGDGAQAAMLEPPPSVLTEDHVQQADDDYLFYRISEGGAPEPFRSGMPAFKSVLDATERWHLVSHLRALDAD